MNNNTPFALGEWDSGVSSDGSLLNGDLLGRRYEMHFNDFARQAGSPVKGRLSYTPVQVVVARNTSGVALSASDVVQFDITTAPSVDSAGNLKTTGDGTIPGLEAVAKLTDANDLKFCGVVDPTLKSDVPDDGICFIVIGGPCEARLPATSPTVAIGDFMRTAASGTVTIETSGTQTFNSLGYALQTRGTPTNDGGLVLMNVCSHLLSI